MHMGRDQMTMRLDELIGRMSRRRLTRLLALAEYLSPELAEEEFQRRASLKHPADLAAESPAPEPPTEVAAGTCRCRLPDEAPPAEPVVSFLDPDGSGPPDWGLPA